MPPDYALVDLRLRDGSGLDVVRALVADSPAASVVVLTGYGSIATALEAIRLGARHYLTKPADVDEILSALARARPATASPPVTVPSLARDRVGAHQPRAGRLRGQRLPGRPRPRHPPALASAQARQVPLTALRGGLRLPSPPVRRPESRRTALLLILPHPLYGASSDAGLPSLVSQGERA